MSFRWTRRRFTAAVGTALILPAGVPAFAAGEKPVVLHAPEASAPALIELCRALQPEGLPANPRVGIKIHGGEARVNYPLFAALRDAYPGAAFVETNWASDFGGSRRHTRTHIEEIRSQGVTGPIDVLDREERDEDYVTVPVRNGIELSEIETTRASLEAYDFLIDLTNFKVPSFAGYTGAVKNTGIGFASPRAKSLVHGPDYAKSEGFFRRLVDSTRGIAEALGERMIHVNIVTALKPVEVAGIETRTGIFGIFASKDPFAVDQAVVDAAYGRENRARLAALPVERKIESGVLQLDLFASYDAPERDVRIETPDIA